MKVTSRRRDVAVCLLCVIITLLGFVGKCHAQLKPGFYNQKCVSKSSDSFGLFTGGAGGVVDVEQTVANLVKEGMKKRVIDAAALLRLQFHDCFVRGCDASILLDDGGSNNEKHAVPNGSVRGYEFIESVKAKLEEKCPGVVSCADIIVMATRDAVALSSSPRVVYNVQTGRRDGPVSNKIEVNLPSPFMKVSESVKAFSDKGLSADDMVYLLGAHTVGKTRCGFVRNRIADPKTNKTLIQKLSKDCPTGGSDNVPVDLDQGTAMVVDKAFFEQLLFNKGVLDLDQALSSDPLTSNTVRKLSEGSLNFGAQFAQAMVKLGEIGVLTSPEGKIRKFCKRSL